MKKNLAKTKASLKIQKVQQLESDIKRENFLRENSTAMISDREYLYLLFALKELNPNSKVLGETKLGDAIKNFENKVKKTLKQMDEEENGQEEEGEEEEDVQDEGQEEQDAVVDEVKENILKDVKTSVMEEVVDQLGIDPKVIAQDTSSNQSDMSSAEIKSLLESAEHQPPPKKKRSYRRKKT
jgi:hypothetical protein